MDTVKRHWHRLRNGFVLPMSLVATFITLLLVGASATYCTVQLHTSQLYLDRTRCRLAAQSAIELTKLVLQEKSNGEFDGLQDPSNTGLSVADIQKYIPLVLAETRKDDFQRKIPGVGQDLAVYVNIKPAPGGAKGLNYVYATAESTRGGRKTTVTLQEAIKIPITTGSIFDYAYFANHDGHLTSQYMVINGDVRANRDFYITGAEINGYVYASNVVHLATSKNKWGWWDDKDPCIRSFSSYNSMYRNGSKKEFKAYAKARPTNPLSRNGAAWVGGFEAVDATQEVESGMPSGLSPLEQLLWRLTHRGSSGGTTTKTQAAPTLTHEIKPSDTVPEMREDYVINAQAVHDDDTQYFYFGSRREAGREIKRSPGILGMPQIAWNSETPYTLQYYKDLAKNAKTVKGKTGGSLICSNCYYDVSTYAPRQLAATFKIDWTPTIGSDELEAESGRAGEDFDNDHSLSDYLTPDESKKDFYNEDEIKEDRTITDAKELADRAAELVPEGGILVYKSITAAEWQKLSSTEKAKWKQMDGTHADAKDGVIGEYKNGYVGMIPRGEPHAGTQLFFDAASFAKTVDKFGTNAGKLETKFADDAWKPHAADYDQKTVVDKVTYTDLGTETITPVGKTQYVNLYNYKKTQPTKRERSSRYPYNYEDVPDDSWKALNSGYSWNSTTYFYSGEICFSGDDMSATTLYNAWRYSVTNLPKDIADDAVNFYKGGRNGWTSTTSGYSDKGDRNSNVAGYIAFDLMKHVWNKTTTYEVEANEITTKPYSGNVAKSRTIPHTQTNTTYKTVYTYKEYYYSQYPVGYVELSTPEVDVELPTIKLVYTPFELANPDFREIRKLVETKYLQMHKYLGTSRTYPYESMGSTSGHIQKGYSSDSASNWMVAETGTRKNELTLDDLADYCGGVYDIAESTVKNEFTKWGSDWTARSSGWTTYYYNTGVDGYLAARIYGIFKGEKAVRYELEYEILSPTEKTADEQKVPDADILEVRYIPVYAYKTYTEASRTERNSWDKVDSEKDGYVRTVGGAKKYLPKAAVTSELNDMDGAYGIDAQSEIGKLGSRLSDADWSSPTYASLFPGGGYGFYNSSSVSGYLTIKVIIDRKAVGGPTYRLEYGYSDTDGSASTGTLSTSGVNNSDIPVYGHITKTEWNNKDYQEKANWVALPAGSWLMNADPDGELSGCVFSASKIETVAQTRARETTNNYGVDVAQAVRKLFQEGGDAYEDGWQPSTPGGYITCVPVGYLHVEVVPDKKMGTDVVAKYEYLSVSAGQVNEQKVWNKGEKLIKTEENYYRTHLGELDGDTRSQVQSRYDAARASYIESRLTQYRNEHSQPQHESTRELRRIFVKDGYKIDATAKLYEGTDEADLILTRNDSGSVDKRLSEGSTTADLLPFREDGARCNYQVDQTAGAADKGAVVLIGTWDYPIVIDGPVVFESDVIIRGFVTGRGTIYSGRNIHVIGDINYKDPPYWPDNGSEPNTKGKDMLVLISRGSIVFGNYVKAWNGKEDVSMDEQWSGPSGLLSGNYINGQANSDDRASKWGKNNTAVPYVEMNYTANDTKGWTKYKVVYNNKKFSRTTVRYYESVIGDYLFISKNNTGGTRPDEASSLASYGSSCRFAQTWDLGFGSSDSYWQTINNFCQYGSYQSKVLDAFAKHKGWGTAERIGETSRKTSVDLWNSHGSELKTFYSSTQSDGYGGYNGGSSQPALTAIQDINSVLYSSMGIFGIIGGKNAAVTINGAVIGQDEALLPYTQYQAKRFSWWPWWSPTRTETSQLALTINWDIRLNLKSAESRKNMEGEEDIDPPLTSGETEAGKMNDPRVLSWQEVPDSFNEEYHATP